MELDLKNHQDPRMLTLTRALFQLGHRGSSGSGCFTWLWLPSDEILVSRILVDVRRLEYDDPDGSNNKIVSAVGSAFGVDLLSPWVSDDFFDGSIEVRAYARGRLNDRLPWHVVGMTGGVLFDVTLGEARVVHHLTISEVVLDWRALSRKLAIEDEECTDAKSIMLNGDFVKNTWLKAYLNTKDFAIAFRSGDHFWPE
jgi:hypothetical protein